MGVIIMITPMNTIPTQVGLCPMAKTVRSQDCTEENLRPLRLTTEIVESQGHTLDRLRSKAKNFISLGHTREISVTTRGRLRAQPGRHLYQLLLAFCLFLGVAGVGKGPLAGG